ncbi:hypothetical protein EJB05_20195 [Eragrostis curvula]|uniref:Uncharacterized protein n=1 Tax=Eragrostis curvula TaxID=38414 RepID=A0A5J9UYE8_9POAL|nr:hypothetical protein EJB05_20195 [Eragrostis curvula]
MAFCTPLFFGSRRHFPARRIAEYVHLHMISGKLMQNMTECWFFYHFITMRAWAARYCGRKHGPARVRDDGPCPGRQRQPMCWHGTALSVSRAVPCLSSDGPGLAGPVPCRPGTARWPDIIMNSSNKGICHDGCTRSGTAATRGSNLSWWAHNMKNRSNT